MLYRTARRAVPLFVAATLAGASFAQQAIRDPQNDMMTVLKHPWVVPPPNRQATVYFTDLKDGDQIETPYVLKFGLSMRGIVPAGNAAGSAGHHHLLINQPLPLDFKQPLPFSDQYIHFGKGEMQTVINVKPGTYQFNLVLADKDHIPYFVYGKPVKVTVTKQNTGVNMAKLLGQARVEVMSPADGEAVRAPFRVNFHASGYNVSSDQAKVPDSGHFRLAIERAGRPPEVLDFREGQTEVWLNPPGGDYTMKLDYLSNVKADAVVTSAKPIRVNVTNPNAK